MPLEDSRLLQRVSPEQRKEIELWNKQPATVLQHYLLPSSLSSSSSYSQHGFGPLVDAFWSHTSRSLIVSPGFSCFFDYLVLNEMYLRSVEEKSFKTVTWWDWGKPWNTSISRVPQMFVQLTLRLLMSYIYGAPILDVSRSHTTTQHSR